MVSAIIWAAIIIHSRIMPKINCCGTPQTNNCVAASYLPDSRSNMIIKYFVIRVTVATLPHQTILCTSDTMLNNCVCSHLPFRYDYSGLPNDRPLAHRELIFSLISKDALWSNRKTTALVMQVFSKNVKCAICVQYLTHRSLEEYSQPAEV